MCRAARQTAKVARWRLDGRAARRYPKEGGPTRGSAGGAEPCVAEADEFEIEEAVGWSAVVGGPDIVAFAREQIAVATFAEARGFEASDAEIKELFTELRYMRRLETGDALRQWMADNSLTTDRIVEACSHLVLRRKLRASIAEDEIAGYYAENRPSYERVELYRLTVADRELALELRAAVEEEDESFCLLAMQYSTDAETAKMGGYAGEVGRDDVAAVVEAAVFGSTPGDLIGPLETEEGWDLILVHDARTIPLEEVWGEIRDLLFDEMVEAALEGAGAAG